MHNPDSDLDIYNTWAFEAYDMWIDSEQERIESMISWDLRKHLKALLSNVWWAYCPTGRWVNYTILKQLENDGKYDFLINSGTNSPHQESSTSSESHGNGGIVLSQQRLYDTKILDGKKPYEILGVSQNATIEEAKKAYRLLAQTYHPDRPWSRKDAKFDKIIDDLRTIGFEDPNHTELPIWEWNNHRPRMQWSEMNQTFELYYQIAQRTALSSEIKDNHPEVHQSAKRAIEVMDRYKQEITESFIRVKRAYELFSQWFPSLDIFGSHLVWIHNQEVPLKNWNGSFYCVGSTITLPNSAVEIFLPTHYKEYTNTDDFNRRWERMWKIPEEIQMPQRNTEPCLIFQREWYRESAIFWPWNTYGKSFCFWKGLIFDIIWILEWYKDGGFSRGFENALQERYPKIPNPLQILEQYLEKSDSWSTETEVEDRETFTKIYWEDFLELCRSIAHPNSLWIEIHENTIVLFSEYDTLYLSQEDIEILRSIALNLFMIRKTVYYQIEEKKKIINFYWAPIR